MEIEKIQIIDYSGQYSHIDNSRIGENELSVIPEGVWEAPRFFIERGSELDYHAHVYETRRNRDTGLMITVKMENVYLEPHRKGKVKRTTKIEGIGDKERLDLISSAQRVLGHIPEENRRRPSKNAVCIGSFADLEVENE